MKERIQLLLDHFKLSSAQFAESIGVQRSSISHILSGRNNPSYDFLIKTLLYFSEINAEWLLLGNNPMLKSQLSQNPKEERQITTQNPDLFSQKPLKNDTLKNTIIADNVKETKTLDSNEQLNKTQEINEVTNVNNVEKLILIYENNTFEIIQRK